MANATKVVDIDSHFFEPFTWVRDVNPALFEDMKTSLPKFSYEDVLFSEILSSVPEEQREETRRGLPMDFLGGDRDEVVDMEEAAEKIDNMAGMQGILKRPGSLGGADRIAFCDEQGIDIQVLHPSFAMFEYLRIKRHNRKLLAPFCASYNDWAVARVDGRTDRLLPSGIVDLTDANQAAKELARLRNLGSRTWLVPLDPWDGRPLSHPANDPLWAASVDLGMVPVFHIGWGSHRIDHDWLNTGRPNKAMANYHVLVAISAYIPELAIVDLIFNGVFEKYPDLVILCSEFGLTWLLALNDKLWPPENHVSQQTFVPWHLPLLPTEYLERNVRVSPLPGDPVELFINGGGGANRLLFGSDYPHPEGSGGAIEEFNAAFDGKVDAEAQAQFFGKNAVDLLALN